MKLPAFYGSVPLTEPELKWMLVGEKLAEEGTLMYRDVWDDTSPLAAGVYWILHELFGRSHTAYQILGFLLIIFQSFYFNNFLLSTKAYNENTYVPALIYGLLMCSFFQFYTLSPMLISLTFILRAINKVFYDIEHKTGNFNLLSSGILMGVASLFYLPSLVIAIALLFSYLLFTGTTVKSYFLFFYGILLPWLLVLVYYYWADALYPFYINYIYSLLTLDNIVYMDYGILLTLILIPLVFLILSFFKLFEAKRFNNFQERFQQSMFFLFLMCLISWWISNNRMPAQLILFIPIAAFYISHFFLLIRRKFITEIVFTFFFIAVVFTHFSTLYQWKPVSRWLNYDNLLVTETPWDEMAEGKKILFIGDDLSVYKNSALATPYLNWQLSSQHLAHPDYYDNLMAVFTRFSQDPPEVIIDTVGVTKNLMEKMPPISAKYEEGALPGTYVIKKP